MKKKTGRLQTVITVGRRRYPKFKIVAVENFRRPPPPAHLSDSVAVFKAELGRFCVERIVDRLHFIVIIVLKRPAAFASIFRSKYTVHLPVLPTIVHA